MPINTVNEDKPPLFLEELKVRCPAHGMVALRPNIHLGYVESSNKTGQVHINPECGCRFVFGRSASSIFHYRNGG